MKTGILAFASLCLVASGAELVDGPMLGHTTDTEATIWVGADGEAELGARSGLAADDITPLVHAESIRLEAAHGFAGTFKITGLKPSTRYYYQITLDGKPAGEVSTFTTPGPAAEPGKLRFAFTSCLGRKGEEPAAGWAGAF